MRFLLGALLLVAACARPQPGTATPASVALVEAPAWQRLSAQHRVRVVVTLDGGKQDVRTLRGLIAVGQPDRFRLRALGPAGITLFDLLVRKGEAKVISAIRSASDGASGKALAGVITSLAADLACAYALEPKAQGRSTKLDGDAVVVEEPGRRVRLSRFMGVPATWRRAEIFAGKYRVVVEVDEVVVDPTLDPAVFDD